MAVSKIPAGVKPNVKSICAEVVDANPNQVRNVWGYTTTEDHNNRKCVDYMIYTTAGGDQVAKYHLDNKVRLRVDLMIWNRRIIRSYAKPGIPAWTWAPYSGKSPHTDHPHVQYKDGAYVPPKDVIHPKNPNGVAKGQKVKVTANGGLHARTSPGGPLTLDKDGEPLVREEGYEFTITADLVNGWATGGHNWYSSDYLDQVAPTPPAPKPAWSKDPVVTLSMAKVPGSVSYLQGVVRVDGVTASDGSKHPVVYLLAQDPGNDGNTRFLAFSANGTYLNSMTVKNGGHGQTFHAYRSAAGNLYVWTLIGSTAYRIKWQPGKTITTSSAGVDKMAYGDARPVGTYEHWVGFRDATDTRETFTLHDRFGFTDPANNSPAPVKRITVNKRKSPTQQTWAFSDTRIYRLYGATNSDPPNGSKLHLLDVLDWSGKLLLSLDITKMHVPTTSDEPEGITFTGTPGSLLVGKREGSTDKAKRTYPIWQMSGLP
jgi:hypothetical protein